MTATAAYQDAIALVQAAAATYGPMPQHVCRSIERQLRERISAIEATR